MSGKLNVGLKVRPLPKVDLRATNAGEFVANMGQTDDVVAIAQKGFQRGLFEKVIVYGTNENGCAVDYAAFGVTGSGDDNDMVSIDADDTVSMIQRTDRGAAEGVSRTYARFLSLGLNPTVRFHYRPEIASNPELRAKHNAELGLVEREALQVADGYVIISHRLTPGKDGGQYFQFGRGRKLG